jgi:DNA-binding NarL/FixJ family response regulator
MSKKISLTDKQQNLLMQIVTSRTHQQDHIERAKIILLSSDGKTNKQIQSELSVTKPTVIKWHSRH